jgi:hypothetical protein
LLAVINLGNPDERTVRNPAEEILAVTGKDLPRVEVPIPLDEGLRRTIPHFANPPRLERAMA